jgi:hypothetical protein
MAPRIGCRILRSCYQGEIRAPPLFRRGRDQLFFLGIRRSEYHYLGYRQPVGEHLKYLVWARGALCARPMAALAWSSSPRHLGARDRCIGWNQEALGGTFL